MLRIFISFSPNQGDQNVKNGIKVITDTSKVQLEDLFTALGVCTSLRRSSSILDSMILEIDRNNVKVIPTDNNFISIKEEDVDYVSPEKIPYAHLFFKELRLDINDGIQDHLNLKENSGAIVQKSKIPTIPKPNNIIKKRWKKK